MLCWSHGRMAGPGPCVGHILQPRLHARATTARATARVPLIRLIDDDGSGPRDDCRRDVFFVATAIRSTHASCTCSEVHVRQLVKTCVKKAAVNACPVSARAPYQRGHLARADARGRFLHLSYSPLATQSFSLLTGADQWCTESCAF